LLGDTLLTAVLTCAEHLRGSDFSAERRAGFCLMGACQDCWVRLADGRRVRACSTLLEEGLAISREPGRQA
jgi:aerobic-type carbon monoxide dehydrogenase small subunit (CoxS/CutS family)